MGHFCSAEKLQDTKSARFGRSCAFCVTIFCVLHVWQYVLIQELHFGSFFKKGDGNCEQRLRSIREDGFRICNF